MALFENYERRIDKINGVLAQYGIGSVEECREICKEKGCKSKVVIGGACITQSFADEIGADGYSKDAAECVKLVERLLNS